MIYMPTGHGLNDLVRISTNQRNYAALYKNEQCPKALHRAIYSGNFDTAWVLVGLDLTDRSPRLDGPKLSLSGCRPTALRAIVDADDVVILHKVIRDLGVAYLQPDAARVPRKKGRNLILDDCRSAAMIDCLAEHLLVPNIGPGEETAQNDPDGVGNVFLTSDLFFIRRAIDKQPELLTKAVWDGWRMLQYAVKKRSLPLLALYFELMNS